jgi:hypothetical protein
MISKIFFDVLIPVPAILDNDADNNNAAQSRRAVTSQQWK